MEEIFHFINIIFFQFSGTKKESKPILAEKEGDLPTSFNFPSSTGFECEPSPPYPSLIVRQPTFKHKSTAKDILSPNLENCGSSKSPSSSPRSWDPFETSLSSAFDLEPSQSCYVSPGLMSPPETISSPHPNVRLSNDLKSPPLRLEVIQDVQSVRNM